MFKSALRTKNDALPTNQLTNGNMEAASLIAKGTTIEGKFKSSDNVRVDGTIKGEVYCDKRLIIGATGWIEGTINTNEATVRGHIKGNLVVQGVLRLESTAKIEGTILAKILEVEEGAQYEGDCKVGERFVKGGHQEVAMVA